MTTNARNTLLSVAIALALCPRVLAITRDDVIARAQAWYNAGIKYSQSPPYQDGYRRDCSGFVSYCWGASSSGGGYTTGTIGNICTHIAKDDLKPGDALLNVGYGHVLLFHQWVDSNHTQYLGYDMANETLNLKHYNIPYQYWSGYDPSGYVPVRYNGIEDCSPANNIHWTAAPADNRWYRSNERLTYRVDGSDPVSVHETATCHDATYQTHDGYLDLNYACPGWQEYHVHASNGCGSSDAGWIGGWDPNAPNLDWASDTASGGTWLTGNPVAKWTYSDDQSGVKVCWYRWNGGGWVDGNGSLAIPEGSNTLEIYVEDSAWNGGTQSGNSKTISAVFKRDTSIPSISGIAGAPLSTWFTDAKNITWSANDATSGIAATVLTWDNGKTGPTVPEGKHTGTITAVDYAGNQAAPVTVGPFWRDSTLPAVTATLTPSVADGQNGWYITQPTLTVSASDPNGANGSGIDKVYYTIDGSPSPYETPVLVPVGTHTVSGSATDAATNSGSSGPSIVKVDVTAPTFSNEPALTFTGLIGLSGSWKGMDPESGIAGYEYRVGTTPGGSDVKSATPATAESFALSGLSLVEGQAYYLTVKAQNAAGLWSAESTSAPTYPRPTGYDVAPNFNNGGESVVPRHSEHYLVLDSIGQLAVETSSSSAYILQSGYWHTGAASPIISADLPEILRIVAGIVPATPYEIGRYDDASPAGVDMLDAVKAARKVAGLE